MDNRMQPILPMGHPMSIPRPRCGRLAGAALLLACALAASAQTPGPAGARADAGAPGDADSPWEGALGLIVSNGTDYMGSDQRGTSVRPRFFLRYGRFSISDAGGFVTRRNDDISRGLGIDLRQTDDLRISLGLRYDRGRSDDGSPALNGLGDIDKTLRVRLGGHWRIDEHWRMSGGWTIDALNRGGGNFAEASLIRERRISPFTTWHAGVSLSLAGPVYMRSYFGVSPEQSVRTGYPVYRPDGGLRDVTFSIGARSELGPHWVALGGMNFSRLLGPTLDSPIVKQATSWGINGGLAWRF